MPRNWCDHRASASGSSENQPSYGFFSMSASVKENPPQHTFLPTRVASFHTLSWTRFVSVICIVGFRWYTKRLHGGAAARRPRAS